VAFEELKRRQAAAWSAAPFENLEPEIAAMHDDLVRRLAPRPGERWLDVCCGPGAVAMRAARAGAEVTGVDLAPVLIDTAKRLAEEQGLEIGYEVGDCEQLRFADAAFDVVSSTCGIMFAPDHRATARELARVVASGGRIGLANWRPEGGVGEMFRMMAPFQPAPPAGAGNPFDWGREDHVGELLGDAFELEFEEHESVFRIDSGEAYWRLFSENYGPTKTLAESLDAERREDLHRTWVEFFEQRYRRAGEIAHVREYLLVLGTRG
jgi:SAM-dependent methyltransferase